MATVSIILTVTHAQQQKLHSQSGQLLLRYCRPAGQWVEALPVGNGTMGAMIYGRVEQEIIQFNHDAIWTGQPMDYQNPGAAEVLPEIRRLLFEDRQRDAEQLAQREFMSRPLRQCAYQPFADLILRFQDHESPKNYLRLLNIETAVSEVKYTVNETNYTREIFASYPDQVIVIRLAADKPGKMDFTVSYKISCM